MRGAARAGATTEARGGRVVVPRREPVPGRAVGEDEVAVGGRERADEVAGRSESSFEGEGRKDSEARKDWPDPDLGPAEEDWMCVDEEDAKEVEGRKESRKEWLLGA